MFRKNISNKTNLGIEAKSFLDNGDLVPDSVTIKMLENEVLLNKQVKGYIFDGFPRTLAQAKSLDTFLNSINLKINATIALDVDENELLKVSKEINNSNLIYNVVDVSNFDQVQKTVSEIT